MSRRPPLLRLLLLASVSGLSACSSGSGGGGAAGFQLSGISVADDEPVKVNQPITFIFTEPVDFSTVSLNTISIQTTSGTPATGTFFMPTGSPNRVVFQPSCPVLASLADTGLIPGSTPYVIRVLGQSSGAANTIRSTTGAELGVTQVRSFTTAPAGDDAFLDTRPGSGPAPANGASYLEVGSAREQHFFQRNVVLDFDAPLNLYSDPEERLAVVVQFDQALQPAADNVTEDRLFLEYIAGDQTNEAAWVRIDTRVTLVENCSELGAIVRLEPVGILPPGRRIRAHVLAGIRDLVDDSGAEDADFAEFRTRAVDFANLMPPDLQSEEFFEAFDFGGAGEASFEDTDVLEDVPAAVWGGGKLTSAFDFFADPCSGGPATTFDWVVTGQTVLDTDGDLLIGADGTTSLVVEGSGPRAGVIDLRNMTIAAGARVRVQGSNPLRINATGNVVIDGVLDASGFDAGDVDEGNTGNVLEEGGVGGPGGGRGGHANEVLTDSTPRGGFGQGPLDEFNEGGEGGETGFAPSQLLKEARRPGGGAGGRFAATADAQPGDDGVNTATGAVTNQQPPSGGSVQSGPFVDGNPDGPNDFFGYRAVGAGSITDLIRGELPSLWGGYGGGGGGNAAPANSFPNPTWTPASDEKGGAGGGGGGAVHIRALGTVAFGPAGLIRSDGGRGGRGENVLGFDFIGGSGGSGSGGHIVVESAQTISAPKASAVGGPKIVGFTSGGATPSAGGRGGPGVVQLHVPNPTTMPPTGIVSTPAAFVLVPTYSRSSIARSEWIPIGSADLEPDGTLGMLAFLFAGTDPVAGANQGKVLDVDQDGVVDELSPVLDLPLAGNAVVLDGVTLRIDGASDLLTGANDVYVRNETLLEGFVLRLSAGAEQQDFDIASASYDPAADRLFVVVGASGAGLDDFVQANPGADFQIVPRFFVVTTCDVAGQLATTSFVRIRFQAARDDGTGAPDAANPLVDWTGDISAFNTQAPGELDFFRFEVEFDLGVPGAATQPVSLEFLRVPFTF